MPVISRGLVFKMFISSLVFLLLINLQHGQCAPQSSEGFIDQSTFQVGQGVQTTSGLIVGHAAKTATDVSEYLGIPFAQAPVGDLRFVAPQQYCGSGTITADKFVRTRITAETK